MIAMWNDFDLFLDGWIVAAGILCAVSAALLGNFLVLRRLSLLGDAISHAVLPGLAVAFLLTGSRSSWPMFLGAVIVGVLTTLLIEAVRGMGKVDEGAAMGVVFTSLFALGLVLIVQAADRVDLDPSCVLYGAIEFTPLDTVRIWGFDVPRVIPLLSGVCLLNLLFVVTCFKELKISAFDPALATAMGFRARLMHYALTTLVAITAVASFESVGNILVVAMFIAPPAAAYMLTDRLSWMVVISVGIAIVSAVTGHFAAQIVPAWFGMRSTSTAGMIAVAAGVWFLLAAMAGPKHGIMIKVVRRVRLSLQILSDDLLALLYRIEEGNRSVTPRLKELRGLLMARSTTTWLVAKYQAMRGWVMVTPEGYGLTEQGRQRARNLVRSHRLWEQYLVHAAGVSHDRIHDHAERLEHYTDRDLRKRLSDDLAGPDEDPHGSRIPPEA